MKIESLYHTGFTVSDIDRSIEFPPEGASTAPSYRQSSTITRRIAATLDRRQGPPRVHVRHRQPFGRGQRRERREVLDQAGVCGFRSIVITQIGPS